MRQRNVKRKFEIIESNREYLAEDPEALRGSWQSVFGNSAPVFLEIGSGKGKFISTLAGRHPENNYVAVEAQTNVGIRILEKAGELGLSNLRVVLRKVDDIRQFFAPGEVSGIYLNFSDPLPKARYEKRRLTTAARLSGYSEILAPGGCIEIKTDNDGFFDFTLEEAKKSGLSQKIVTRNLHKSLYSRDNITTEYEEKFLGEGKRINYAALCLTSEGKGGNSMSEERSYRSDRIKKGPHKWMQRSMMYVAGKTQEEVHRPVIGVVGSWTDMFPGHVHLDKIAQAVCEGVYMAGGNPVNFSTVAVCDGIAMNSLGMKYSLPSRELIADSVETVAEGHAFDAMVLVPTCDKIVPGMIMAALRVNIPTIIVTGGPAFPSIYHGERFDHVKMAEIARDVAAGKLPFEYEEEMEEVGPYGGTCGACVEMATANSMGCLLEPLGLGLPGNGTIPAPFSARMRLAKKAGMQIMKLLEWDLKPRDIVDRQTVLNCIAIDMMLGCSTNTALHLPAIANAAGTKVTLDDFDRLSRITPQVVKLAPANDILCVDFHRAGGMSALIKIAIEHGHMDGSKMTVTGKTQAENVKDAEVWDDTIIHPYDQPVSPEGGLFVLKGNLAPLGSVIKVGGVKPEMLVHSGPARVFDSEQEGFHALVNGGVHHGDVIVIRYEGPKGGPGMQEMLSLTQAMASYGFDSDVALVTDGRFSGASIGGVIGHVSPEAALGGLIGLVEDGDIISYDVFKRTISLDVDEKVLEERRKNHVPHEPNIKSGWLARYAQLARPVSEGAVIKADIEVEEDEKNIKI